MKNNILITGTVAFDDIETPFGKSGTIVGGAATYIGLAASFFSKKLFEVNKSKAQKFGILTFSK